MLFTAAGMSADIALQQLLTALRFDAWLHEDVFQPKWWFLVGLFTFFTFVWCKRVNKKRLTEIVLCAGLTGIAVLILDEFGEELTLWDYPTDVMPLFPPLTAINLACLPMIYSLVYQHFGTWRRYLWASIVMSAVFAFVFEPVLSWAGFYQLLKWKYYYGFPIYIALALLIRWTVIRIYAIARKAECEIDPPPTIL
jgi:hypothetical protein